MRFHVELIARENFGPLEAVPVQKLIFAHLSKLMQSGHVKESGIYSDERGGFLILDAESPEELHGMLTPIIDAISFRTHPYVSIDTLKSTFDAYEKSLKSR